MNADREQSNAEDRFATTVLRHEGAVAKVKIDACFFDCYMSRCQNCSNYNLNEPTRELIVAARVQTINIIILWVTGKKYILAATPRW